MQNHFLYFPMVKRVQHLEGVSSKWRKTTSLREVYLVHIRFQVAWRENEKNIFPLEEGGKGAWWMLNKREDVSYEGDQAQFQQHNFALFFSYNKHAYGFLL